MSTLEFLMKDNYGENHEEILIYEVKKMLNGGFTGRNQEEVQKHVDELKAKGIGAPDETPCFFPVFRDLITQEDIIDCLSDSGHTPEAEFVMLCTQDDIYITVGSDHTDRDLEKDSIPKAKQIYPNIIGQKVWKYSEIKEHWDDIELKSWIKDPDSGEIILFQDTKLSAMLTPDDLLEEAKKTAELDSLDGLVILSGTVAANKQINYTSYFKVQLVDKKSNREITCEYEMTPISSWFKKDLD